jgi:hypothetical protein
VLDATKWKLPYGDITVRDEQSFRELTYLFHAFQKTRDGMEKRTQARCLIIFARDYLVLGIEDAADECFHESSVVCPEYLDKYIIEDMSKFLEFDKAAQDMAEWYQEKFKI